VSIRYRLRTLLIDLALGPPMLAYFGESFVHRLVYGPPSIGYNGPLPPEVRANHGR